MSFYTVALALSFDPGSFDPRRAATGGVTHRPWPEAERRRARHRLGGYREYDAAPHVAQAVEGVWTYRALPDHLAAAIASHRVLPDPAVSVAWCCTRHGDGLPREPRLIVIGPKLQASVHQYQPGSEIAAVKLKLEWAEPLLDLAPTDLTDSVCDLAALHPRLAGELLESLGGTRTVDQALDALSAGIVRATERRRERSRAASGAAFDLLRDSAGRLTIEQIASLTGVSLRHLRRVARRETGMPLKAYARMLRLVRTIAATDRVPSGSPIEWARVAVDAGYCDQPHLIRECRAISGLSPTELARERRGELDLDPWPGADFTPRPAWAISTGSHTPPGPGIRHAHRSLRDGADAVSLRE